jgi:ABC-type transporter Mla subunit MlaD
MRKQRNALKAGIFIVTATALAFAVAVWIRGLAGFVEKMQLRTVTFELRDDLAGLNVGDDVRIGGFKVGDVRRIEIVARDDPRLQGRVSAGEPALILVTFALPQRFELRDGAEVGIQTTVTEKTCLNISRLGTGQALAADLALVGQPSPLAQVMADLRQISPMVRHTLADIHTRTLPGINQILADVQTQTVPAINQTVAAYKTTAETGTTFLAELRGQLKPIIDRYHGVADSTRGMMDEIRSLFGDTGDDFRGTVANLNATTGTLKQRLPGLLEQADEVLAAVQSAVEGATEAMDDIRQTAANTRDLSGSARSIVVGNKGRMDSMIKSLNLTATNLEMGSSEIRSRPWRLLYSPKRGEVANLALFDAAREFARGAGELNDAAQALRDAVKAPEADAGKLEQLRTHLEQTFIRFGEMEQKLWESVKD